MTGGIGYAQLAAYRRRLRRRYAVKRWLVRVLYAGGYVVVTGAAVAVLVAIGG